MNSERVRPILVVDDDPKIVRLVRMYLERERYRVIEAFDGAAALREIEAHAPALVILDLMLPQVDGLSVVRTVRDGGDTPIIILSARGTAPDRIVGLSLGADDYLPKPFSPAELVLRVNRVLARSGGSRAQDSMPELQLNGLTIDRERHAVAVDGNAVTLSAVELRILVALLEAGGRILSRERLLDAAYGSNAGDVLDRTIDVHVGRLRDKLGDPALAPRFIATVRGVGYRAASSQRSTAATGGPG